MRPVSSVLCVLHVPASCVSHRRRAACHGGPPLYVRVTRTSLRRALRTRVPWHHRRQRRKEKEKKRSKKGKKEKREKKAKKEKKRKREKAPVEHCADTYLRGFRTVPTGYQPPAYRTYRRRRAAGAPRYVRRTCTNLGRAVRTAYRGTPGGAQYHHWQAHPAQGRQRRRPGR